MCYPYLTSRAQLPKFVHIVREREWVCAIRSCSCLRAYTEVHYICSVISVLCPCLSERLPKPFECVEAFLDVYLFSVRPHISRTIGIIDKAVLEFVLCRKCFVYRFVYYYAHIKQPPFLHCSVPFRFRKRRPLSGTHPLTRCIPSFRALRLSATIPRRSHYPSGFSLSSLRP